MPPAIMLLTHIAPFSLLLLLLLQRAPYTAVRGLVRGVVEEEKVTEVDKLSDFSVSCSTSETLVVCIRTDGWSLILRQ